MTELLTAAQMRAIEAAAIASGEVTGLELMERAGRGVVEAILAEWPELRATSHRAVVLCGPGNNGGDGFVVARLLKDWGWEVEVFLYGDAERLPPDARVNYERWVGMGEIKELTERAFRARHPVHGDAYADLYVDAIFGTGLTRPPAGDLAGFLRHLGGYGGETYPRLVAIDAPSGLCLDSGRMLIAGWARPSAALTVTFDCLRAGHFLDEGPEHCGRVVVADIGVGPWRQLKDPVRRRGHWTGIRQRVMLSLAGPLASPDGGSYTPGALPTYMLGKKGWVEARNAHKYAHGHSLILSGPSGRGGAARLSARGALRIGAGVVTVGCPLDAIPEHAARLDAVMLRGVADGAALAGALEDKRINALCLGPGMGTGAREAGLLAVALSKPVPGLTGDLSSGGGAGGTGGPEAGPGRGLDLARDPPSPPHEGEGGRVLPRATPAGQALPLPHVGRGGGRGASSKDRPKLVLDADALTILSQQPDLFSALHEGCVLTPHAGEFARLFPDIAEKLAAPATKGPAYSKVDATREAAKRAGCTVLYKGPDTVIADPTGRCAINSAHYDRAAPWLATAGSGDVLAGFITGLLARGFSPFDAACTGAWLHVECALSFGPGLIAEDLPDALPKVFRALGL
ncbi:NAD(P)H-hydrate epimerase [Tabrizicola piscis]|uniref:NAD(P)H-hydrate epimerase n=1 Tax=Tabrizicola piscis TaxID=2494374 RepID=UPI001FE640C9|nr:NAD(P)H-hydrate epimerase [Tabrizicola piscis]